MLSFGASKGAEIITCLLVRLRLLSSEMVESSHCQTVGGGTIQYVCPVSCYVAALADGGNSDSVLGV